MVSFRLMSATRGPDDLTKEAACWKALVICPIRWLVAERLNVSPYTWCDGGVASPEAVLQDMKDLPLEVEKARRFTSMPAYKHVGYHAAAAFTELLELTQNRQDVLELTDALLKANLIPFAGPLDFSLRRWLDE